MVVRLMIAVVVLLFSSSVSAQGVAPVSGTWSVCAIGATYSGVANCNPGNLLTFSDVGTITMQTNGLFSDMLVSYGVCASGVTGTVVDNASGTYVVNTDSSLLFDFDPMNPGTDTELVWIRPNLDVLITAPDSATDEGYLGMAIRLSSGQSNATMSGAYTLVTMVWDNTPSGMQVESDFGSITFNGSGGFSSSVSRKLVSSTGATTTFTAGGAGNYTVASDGQLTVAGEQGAVSANGEIAMWAVRNGSRAGMQIALKRGTGMTSSALSDGWSIGSAAIETTAGPGATPLIHTDQGNLSFQTTGSATAAWSGTLFANDITMTAMTSGSQAVAGTATLNANGTISLLDAGGPPALDGGVDPSGTLIVARSNDPGEAALVIGIHTCPWPATIGFASPGTGGVAPTLQPAGGYSYIGNLGYGFRIDNGLPGAPALIGISLAPPIGGPGMFSVNLLALDLQFSTVLDSTGAATVPAPIVPLAALDGITAYVQAGVADVGAAQFNVALTQGLMVTMSR